MPGTTKAKKQEKQVETTAEFVARINKQVGKRSGTKRISAEKRRRKGH